MSLRLIAAAFASGAVLFFGGAIVYGGILRNFFPRHFAAIARPKPEAMARLPFVGIEKLIQGAILSVAFFWVFPQSVGLATGLAFGALLALLMEVSFFFGTWTNFKVAAKGVAVPAALGLGRYVAVGVVLAALHG